MGKHIESEVSSPEMRQNHDNPEMSSEEEESKELIISEISRPINKGSSQKTSYYGFSNAKGHPVITSDSDLGDNYRATK